MSRAYRWTDADHVKDTSRNSPFLPANTEHSGVCPCGALTSRSVTAGGPGHPRNGWECVACGEHYMALELLGHVDE